MRLRFGRIPFPILVIFAAIAGAMFYFIDNGNTPPATPAPVATSIVQENTDAPIGNATPNPAPPTSPSTRFAESGRQDLPPESAIFIPDAGIWSNVIQAYLNGSSWDITDLRSNAGHLEGTPWVSEPGNVVISGHVERSNGLPGVFAALQDIEVGDEIQVVSEGITHYYVVTETYMTSPSNLQPIMPTSVDRLTLITCDSYDIVTNAYRERLIVVAERVRSGDA
ncbi:MAG: sortase [Chloroflexota bacterium]